MPNWKSPESRDRLMAAVVASLDQKSLNYSRIAELFGQGTTYHAIEGQFRQVRKDAQQLKEDLENGITEKAAPSTAGSRGINAGGGTRRKAERGSNSTNKRTKPDTNSTKGTKNPSPSNKRDAVLTGRVTKSKSITPTNAKINADKPNWILGGYDNNNVRGFKEEVESSGTSAANTPANPFDFPLTYDGTHDGQLAGLYQFDDSFSSSFASGEFYPFEEA